MPTLLSLRPVQAMTNTDEVRPAILAIAARNLAAIIDAYEDFLDLAFGKDHVGHHLVTKLPGRETHRLADLEAAQGGGGPPS